MAPSTPTTTAGLHPTRPRMQHEVSHVREVFRGMERERWTHTPFSLFISLHFLSVSFFSLQFILPMFLGCDGTGKIQGGIATIGFMSWWPIKVFRPCPAYLEAGYVYRREVLQRYRLHFILTHFLPEFQFVFTYAFQIIGTDHGSSAIQ